MQIKIITSQIDWNLWEEIMKLEDEGWTTSSVIFPHTKYFQNLGFVSSSNSQNNFPSACLYKD